MRKHFAVLLLMLFLSINAVCAIAPIFIVIKIEGPVDAPERGTFWYGPFSEGVAVFGVDGDGDADLLINHWDNTAGQGVTWLENAGRDKFVRQVLSDNHGFTYPGGETRNRPPNFAIGTGMNINVLDVNKDGKDDIVLAGKSGLYRFENRGTPPTMRLDGKAKS